MCGICGIVNFNPDQGVERGLIESMTNTLVHRGPDDEGYFIEGGVALGHRRLSIIDLAGGRQPIFNEDASAVIVFNGEIYNYSDLTRELKIRGHHFRTRSDTETILHAYDEFADEGVHKLRGMFAFAIWDRRRQRLFLARDRLGIKPLYYFRAENFLAFASEIKALLRVPGVPREVDVNALGLYLSLRYVPGPQTMFKQIFKLQPGHLLIFDRNGIRIKKYWDVEYCRSQSRSAAEYCEDFRALLEEAVRLRLMAEVPLGVFLSGGIDSSSVLAMMAKTSASRKIKTFSVGYCTSDPEEEQSNEFQYARLAAARFGAEHHEFRLEAADFRDFLPDLVWYLDEPLADPACIPLFFISRLARQSITVVLSGEGADEILGGYAIYKRMLAMERIYQGLSPAATLARRLVSWLPGDTVRHALQLTALPLQARYRGVARAFFPELKRKLLPGNGEKNSDEVLNELFLSYFKSVNGASALDRMLYLDLKVWLPDDLLIKADKMTMANSLELRVPFLDHRLVEFAATLPPELKLQRGTGKFILRRALRDVLPEAILTRPKKGFPVPTSPWLRTQLRSFTREVLLAPNAACRTYLNLPAIEALVREHEEGRTDRHREIWTLLVFEFWHRVFIDRRLNSGAGAFTGSDSP